MRSKKQKTKLTGRTFKKSANVYAVVGAACCNSRFRTALFRAFDPKSSEGVRTVVNAFLEAVGLSWPVTEKDLAKILAFAAPRQFQPTIVPPTSLRMYKRAVPDFTFETACEAFSDVVCPHWPCDDYSFD